MTGGPARFLWHECDHRPGHGVVIANLPLSEPPVRHSCPRHRLTSWGLVSPSVLACTLWAAVVRTGYLPRGT